MKKPKDIAKQETQYPKYANHLNSASILKLLIKLVYFVGAKVKNTHAPRVPNKKNGSRNRFVKSLMAVIIIFDSLIANYCVWAKEKALVKTHPNITLLVFLMSLIGYPILLFETLIGRYKAFYVSWSIVITGLYIATFFLPNKVLRNTYFKTRNL